LLVSFSVIDGRANGVLPDFVSAFELGMLVLVLGGVDFLVTLRAEVKALGFLLENDFLLERSLDGMEDFLKVRVR